MTTVSLRADCARCAALCCVALAFDRSPLFGFDKPAGQPCRRLTPGGRCSIHAERQARGFGGCVAYDCLGAGQHVTQGLFGGRSWQADPGLLEPMMRAFAAVKAAREFIPVLREAGALPLPAPARRRLGILAQGLDDAAVTPTSPAAMSALEDDVRAFLRSLRPVAERMLQRPAPVESPQPVQRPLQDPGGGGLVDELRPAGAGEVGLVGHEPLHRHGGQALVPEGDGRLA